MKGEKGFSDWLVTRLPLFPLLQQMEVSHHEKLVLVIFVVETLQLLGLQLNPHYDWGNVLNTLSKIVYMFNVPLWDKTYLHLSYWVFLAPFWISVLVVLACIGGTLTLLRNDQEFVHNLFVSCLRNLLHGVCTLLLFPFALNFLALIVCHQGVLWSFPNMQCWSGVAAIHWAVGVCVGALLFFLIVSYHGLVFDNNPQSKTLWSRAHPFCDLLFILAKSCMVIAYHLCMSSSQYLSFSILLCILFATLAIVYTLILPYYQLRALRLRVAQLCLLFSTALITACFTGTKVASNYNGLTFALVGLFSAGFGYFIAGIRVSGTLQEQLLLLDDGQSLGTTTYFPQNLPKHDQRFSAFRDLESDLCEDEGGENSLANSLLIPYISQILFPTDIEVACRFLTAYTRVTGQPPTSLMLAFASRIYTKGLLKFNSSPVVMLHFIEFLAVHTRRLALVHSLVDKLSLNEPSMFVRYAAYKIQNTVRQTMGIRNRLPREILRKARKAHKDCLEQMAVFWNKLCADDADTIHLASITNTITGLRLQGQNLFERALMGGSSGDREMYTKYAQFLEQILMDFESAEEIRTQLQEAADKRASARTGIKSADKRITGSAPSLSIATRHSNLGDSVQTSANTLARFASNMKIIFTLIFLLVVGFFVFEAVNTAQRRHTIGKLHAAGQVRMLSQKCAFLVASVVDAINTGAVSTAEQYRAEILDAANSFRDFHSSLTHGQYGTSYGPHVDYYKNRRIEILRFDTATSSQLDIVGLWDLGFSFYTALQSLTSQPLNSLPSSPQTQFVLQNDEAISLAFNRSVHFYIAENDAQVRLFVIILMVLFIAAIVILLVVYLMLVWNFKKIGSKKITILRLFYLIPKLTLEKLHADAKDRLQKFDIDETEEMTDGEDARDEDRISEAFRDHDRRDEDEGRGGEMTRITVTVDASGRTAKRTATDTADSVSDTASIVSDRSEKLMPIGPVPRVVKPQLAMPKEVVPLWKQQRDAATGLSMAVNVAMNAEAEANKAEVASVSSGSHGSSRGSSHTGSGSQKSSSRTTKSSQNGTSDASRRRRRGARNGSDFGSESEYTAESEEEDDDTAEEEHSSKHGTTLVFLSVTLLVFLLALAGLLIMVITTTSLTNIEQPFEETSDALVLITNQLQTVDFLTDQAQRFVQFGDLAAFVQYWDKLRSGGLTDIHARMGEVERTEDQVRLYTQTEEATNTLLATQAIAVTLAAHAYNLSDSLMQQVQGINWSVSFALGYPLEYASYNLRTPPYQYTNAQSDLAKPASTEKAIARSALFDDKYNADVDRVQQPARAFRDVVLSQSQHQSEIRHQTVLITAALCIYSAILVVVPPMLYNLYASDQLYKLRAFFGVGVMLALVVPIAGAFLVVLLVKINSVSMAFDSLRSVHSLGNDTRVSTRTFSEQTRGFVQFGDRVYYSKYWDFRDRKTYEEQLNSLLLIPHITHDLEAERGLVTRAVNLSMPVRDMEMTAQVLMGWAVNLDLPEVRDHLWNSSSEPGYEDSLIRYPNTPYLYTDTATDSGAPGTLKELMAREAVFGQRYTDLAENAYVPVQTLLDILESRASDLITQGLNDVKEFAKLTVAAGAVALVLSCAFLIMFFVSVLEMMTSRSNDRRESSAIFGSAMRHSAMALVVLSLLICGIFIYGYFDVQSGNSVARDLNAASGREWLASRTMYLAYRTRNASTGTMYEIQQQLRNLVQSMLNGRSELYFGVNRNDPSTYTQRGYNMVGKSAKADEVLFGPTETVDTRFTCPSNFTARSVQSLDDLLQQGVDIGYRSFISLVYFIAGSSSVPLASAPLTSMISLFRPLVEGLEYSTQLYESRLRDEISVHSLWFRVILVAALLLVIGEFVFLFRPMLSKLRREEEGTAVMLKIIPRDVREGVPQINEYLQTGEVADEQELQMIQNAVQELSPVPTIAIDSRGTILMFNKAAEQCFGWQSYEVIEKNVRILMPERIGRQHDSFLLNYQQTGVKHVINETRTLKAVRKNGHEFPAELSVREIKKKGQESTFMGFVLDISNQVKVENQCLLAQRIVRNATVPLVAIDPAGIIVLWNKAMESTFGWEASEVVGQNIALVMEDQFAQRHDDFLQRYMATGQKVILDTTRQVIAKRKNEEFFLAELTVTEYISDDNHLFMAMIRDVTAERELQLSGRISDAILDMLLVPVVTINFDGTITSFSKKASETFGYEQTEVLGRNVKMLMPPDTAEVHDGYLAAYKSTRVKKVIDTSRHVRARRKNGEMFPVELLIREIVWSPTNSTFIGFIVDHSGKAVIERAQKLNFTMTKASAVPLIVIDAAGQVLRFTKAAEECWKYRAQDVIGRNVKMLMPDEIARHHDGYLQHYADTGERHIVGSSRKVKAKKKDGETFPVELWVDEMKLEGEELMFVGYARDVTQEEKNEMELKVNNAVLELCTIPIVTIDHKGTIDTFSRAAREVFGYSEEETKGQNVKMLMGTEHAVRHDGYLQRYLDTGVKHVIDTTRVVEARRKSGQMFPAELSVREVGRSGLPPIFVAYARDLTMEREMEVTNKLNAAIAELCVVPIVAIDDMGKITRFTKASQEAFGYTLDEVMGQNVKMLMPDEIAVQHDLYLSNYRLTGVKRILGTTRRVTGKHKDGTQFPVEIQVREVKMEGERPIFIGYVRDIQQDIELSHLNAISTAAIDLMTIPVIIIDRRGTVQTFSKAAVEVFGFATDEVVGQNIKMLMPPEIAAVHDGYLKRYIETGTKRVIDSTRMIEAKRKNGEVFPAEISVREIKGEGFESSYVGYCRDASTDIILAAEQRWGQVCADLSPVPIIVINHEGIVQKFTKSAEEVFGWPVEEVIGKNVKMLMPDAIARNHDQFLAAYMQTHEKHVVDRSRVLEARRKDGTMFTMELRVKEITQAGGQSIFLGFARDLTEDVGAERAAKVNTAVMDLAPIATIIINMAGKVQSFNRAAEETFGFTAEEMLGQNINKLMPPKIAARHDGYLAAYKATRVKYVIDNQRVVEAQRKNGDIFSAEISVRELSQADGSSLFVGYVFELRAEAMVAELKEVVDTLVTAIPTALVMIDGESTITRCNPAAAKLWGYDNVGEMEGKNVAILMPSDVAKRHHSYLTAYKVTGIKTAIDSSRVVYAKHRSGNHFAVEITVKEVEAEGDNKAFLALITPLNELKPLPDATELHLIADLATDPMIAADRIGCVLVFNAPAERLLGYSRSEIIGKHISAVIMGGVGAHHDLREVSCRGKSGELLHVQLRVTVLCEGMAHLVTLKTL
eukprot:TRINITY_DN7211_c0_g1_i2.p1 TRINITY_DN7211_c0_g1~~TRINITY_DN7211_c0_g1_i2.p1  ORF type:complete len:3252 (+),score=553.21 TRINITY_DN7211_c0_g1_i2:140-9895(+)